MPTILRVHGLRFMIFVDDHPPPHVHVSGRGDAKITIGSSFSLLSNTGMSKADIARARNVVKEHHNLLRDAWVRIHGRID
ncbi:DUF4160 domain-containing protein [Sphingomonas koreensis]|nr:DUF4160 domain-containing protein [Sphingomonas koreensis]